MKNLLFCFLVIFMVGLQTYAQNTKTADGIKKSELPVVYLPENLSVHFISPEPIQYADISTNMITGDLPLENVLRIRLNKDSLIKGTEFDDAVITIAGEKFIAQYHIVSANKVTGRDAVTDIEILPGDTRPLDVSGIGLSGNQLKSICLNLASRRTSGTVSKSEAFGISGTVYKIYTFGNYLFLDLGYRNQTNLPYNIDELRFKIDDKKITKASNVQSLEIKPELVLFKTSEFRHNYRNIFVIKKMSFPGNKVMHIELSEKQLSGRVISLAVAYQDILDADTIPL